MLVPVWNYLYRHKLYYKNVFINIASTVPIFNVCVFSSRAGLQRITPPLKCPTSPNSPLWRTSHLMGTLHLMMRTTAHLPWAAPSPRAPHPRQGSRQPPAAAVCRDPVAALGPVPWGLRRGPTRPCRSGRQRGGRTRRS